MTRDPISRFQELLQQAERVAPPPHNACALATCGHNRQPAVRMVLLKAVDNTGFVFYTNLDSDKGHQLADNAAAALCFWWPQLKQQVRVEGTVEPVSAHEANEYFASRPRGSQIGAWASAQSRELSSRAELLSAAKSFSDKFRDQPVPRPPFWSGYRLAPQRIEFWQEGPDRLHNRELYLRQDSGWKVILLAP